MQAHLLFPEHGGQLGRRRNLPPPRKRGAELMWKWSEVDDVAMAAAKPPTSNRICEATRRIVEGTSTANTPASDDQTVTARSPHELLKAIEFPPRGRKIPHSVRDGRGAHPALRRAGRARARSAPGLRCQASGLPEEAGTVGRQALLAGGQSMAGQGLGLEPVEPPPRKSSRAKKR